MENENLNNNQGPLTLDQLAKYGREVLLPATLNQMIKYNQEVLLPAFDERIKNFITRGEFKNEILELKKTLVSKKEFNEFKDETLTNLDSMLKKMDELLEEKDVRIH